MIRRCLLAALVLLAVAPPAAGARTDKLDKPVVLLAGPEIAQPCSVWAPLRKELTKAGLTAQVQFITLGPAPSPDCASTPKPTLRAWGDGTLPRAAQELGAQLSKLGNVDVVAVGSSGLALRYALMKAEQGRRGVGGATDFAQDVQVEDAVTISTPHAGTEVFADFCNARQPSAYCDAMNGEDPVFLQLEDPAQFGTNPQGAGGTDWSVFAGGAERTVSVEQAVDMDAAHKTIYKNTSFEDKSTMLSMLADVARKPGDAPQYRFKHGKADWAFTANGKPAVPRIVDNLVYGVVPGESGSGGAYAPGCTGFNDLRSNAGDKREGETILNDELPSWKGEKGPLRIVRARAT
jgi:hypothetical protein